MSIRYHIGPKTKIELPQERIDATITFMKVSAKLIIEDEYDRKFLSLKAEDSKLEQYFWDANNRSKQFIRFYTYTK